MLLVLLFIGLAETLHRRLKGEIISVPYLEMNTLTLADIQRLIDSRTFQSVRRFAISVNGENKKNPDNKITDKESSTVASYTCQLCFL